MAVTAAVLPNAAFAVTAYEKTRDGAAADDAAADETKKGKANRVQIAGKRSQNKKVPAANIVHPFVTFFCCMRADLQVFLLRDSRHTAG